MESYNAYVQLARSVLRGSLGIVETLFLVLVAVVCLFKPDRVASAPKFRMSWLCFLLGMAVGLAANGLMTTAAMFGLEEKNALSGLANVCAGVWHLSEALTIVAYFLLFASLVPPAGAKREQ